MKPMNSTEIEECVEIIKTKLESKNHSYHIQGASTGTVYVYVDTILNGNYYIRIADHSRGMKGVSDKFTEIYSVEEANNYRIPKVVYKPEKTESEKLESKKRWLQSEINKYEGGKIRSRIGAKKADAKAEELKKELSELNK